MGDHGGRLSGGLSACACECVCVVVWRRVFPREPDEPRVTVGNRRRRGDVTVTAGRIVTSRARRLAVIIYVWTGYGPMWSRARECKYIYKRRRRGRSIDCSSSSSPVPAALCVYTLLRRAGAEPGLAGRAHA